MPDYITKLFTNKLKDLHTALPGRVEAYDKATQKANIKPLIKSDYFDDQDVRIIESLPVITNVPVVFPGAGDFRITFPINKGDTVLIIFSEGSLDKWLSKGGEVDPAIYSRHELTDAIAIPGLRDFVNTTASHETAMVLETDTELLLGSQSASEGAIKGNERDSAEQTFLTALNTLAAATMASAPAKAAFAAAVTTFKAAVTSAVSSKVKVE
jgi:hypothetical protein